VRIPSLADPEILAGEVKHRGRLLLLLDYDGVLVDIAPTPDQARPDRALLSLLGDLAARDDMTVAVVSGRSPEDLISLLPVPGLLMAACHGAALVCGGRTKWLVKTPVKGLDAFGAAARRLIEGRAGFLVEEKQAAVAVHYRLADPREAAYVRRELTRRFEPLLADLGLELLSGHQVLEARPAEATKGRVVTMLMGCYPGFPVYLGDDRTDEDAFASIGEQGLTVLVAAHDRESLAEKRLSSPAQVRRFLQVLAHGRGKADPKRS